MFAAELVFAMLEIVFTLLFGALLSPRVVIMDDAVSAILMALFTHS
jgi:hypothetical protein